MFPHPLPFSPWEKGAWYRLNNTPSDVSGGFLFGFAGASAPPDESGGCLCGFAGALLFGHTQLVPKRRSGSPAPPEGGRRGRGMRPRPFYRVGITTVIFTTRSSMRSSGSR